MILCGTSYWEPPEISNASIPCSISTGTSSIISSTVFPPGTFSLPDILPFTLAARDFTPSCNDAGVLLDFWRSTRETNLSGYRSDAFDILLDAARAAESPEVRDAYLHDAEAILLSDAPVIPLLSLGGSYRLAGGLAGLYRAPDGVYFLYGVRPEAG